MASTRHEITAMDEAALRDVRGTDIAMIYQEPMIALEAARCAYCSRRSILYRPAQANQRAGRAPFASCDVQ
jgi:ABC-type microcin C transport system duplicated ATPase subunit YejF